jgi:hypothetical protein
MLIRLEKFTRTPSWQLHKNKLLNIRKTAALYSRQRCMFQIETYLQSRNYQLNAEMQSNCTIMRCSGDNVDTSFLMDVDDGHHHGVVFSVLGPYDHRFDHTPDVTTPLPLCSNLSHLDVCNTDFCELPLKLHAITVG